MSGIVGIVHTDGSPVDGQVLRQLTEAMVFRGPDAQAIKELGIVGLGHTLFATSGESKPRTQPLTLDGEVWICADARIDGREELRAELSDEGVPKGSLASDVELILLAYRAWGESFLARLAGDFSLIIWDAPRQRLVCARDSFGIKPLFYAAIGNILAVSNTFETLRLLPQVSGRLDELAIADYLLFSFQKDPAATELADIRRVPAAHVLTWAPGQALSVSRYWSLPVEKTLRYASEGEYVDHFNEIFGRAVGDRLRQPKVAITMSGGLDSTSIAATAARITREQELDCELGAFTRIFGHLMPDVEGGWARKVADHLRMPIELTVSDAFESGSDLPVVAAKRVTDPHVEAITAFARVALTGYGGDPLNRGSSGYYAERIARGELAALAEDLVRTFRAGKTPPLLVRTLWRRWRARSRTLQQYPMWINADLERRLDLRVRWREITGREPFGWSRRAELESSFWPSFLESFDPGVTGELVEYRHPFFDRRLVEFMMRVPSIPWCLQKLLLRQAMSGMLPPEILARPKAVLAANPNDLLLSREPAEWWRDRFEPDSAIGDFIDIEELVRAAERHAQTGVFDIDALLRPVYLDRHLRDLG